MGHPIPLNQTAHRATLPHLSSASQPTRLKPLALAIGYAIFAGAFGMLTLPAGNAHAADSTVAAKVGSEARRAYDIPAGPLEATLNRFGRESGILLSYSTDLAAGRQSKGLRGSYSVAEALPLLLQDTGLAAVAQGNGSYALTRQHGAVAAEAEAAPALPVVMVTASPVRLYETPDVNAGALGVRATLDTPFSIGSYTTDTIENQRARTALDVLKNDPSVTPVTYAASFDGVAVRGFSANTFNNVRRDGLLANVYADVPLENKERVDVLKGVSGFLYGVGDPSGLVNYVLKRPTRDPLLSVTGEVRSQDGFYTNVDAGGPMGTAGNMGYRFNAAYEKVGNFTHPGDLDRKFISGAVDVKINADAMLQLDFDYQEKSQAANASIGPREDGTLVPAASIDPRVLIGQPWGRYASTSWNTSARLDYAVTNDWTLTGQLGYGSTKRNAQFNNVYLVGMNGDVLDGGISYEGEGYSVASAQFFATGRIETGPVAHEVVAGYSYSKMDYPEGPYLSLPDMIGNIYHPVAAPDPGLPDDTNLPTAHSVQHSVFASDTIALSERWALLLGARYIDYVNDKPRDYPDSGVRLHYTTSHTVPTASVLFKPMPHTTFYATYTKGFEQGAYAPSWSDNAYERLDPITSTQYELGVKSNAIDGLMLTAALFDIDKPLQSVSSVDNLFKTQGRQHHRGIEFAANGAITSQLSGILGMAWLDAEQLDTGDAAVDGKRPANVAKFQASAFLDYRVAAVPGLSLNAGYYHVGNRPLDAANTIMVDAFGRWDIGAAYTFALAGKPSVLRFAVENVGDKRYWESVVYNSVGLAQPRTFRLSLTTHF